MAKFLLQIKYEQPRLTMSHARWFGLSYQRIPSCYAITTPACPSKCKFYFFRNGIGDLTHSFCFTCQACTAILAVTRPQPGGRNLTIITPEIVKNMFSY